MKPVMTIDIKNFQNENELLCACQHLEGMSFSQLAAFLKLRIPENPLRRKGWAGQAIELALGAAAGNKAAPDFCNLGIELKTIPINHLGKPAESTYITSISLLKIHQETWLTSQCYAKLKRVLWVPIEADKKIPFPHRRIGRAVLWSPSARDESILEQDWHELTTMIVMGKIAEINAGIGQYLQVRPKAANSQSLGYTFDEEGNKTLTLPRGFYLRSRFTSSILKQV
ncbi:DNA mismatch repair protein MutH [Legionella londiniensis]|nr:DNA mismatch repair endonuclease MutH [Legionella londiniensis]STX92856.1 DNA mismatch repair protein MutH [Legionella londiniensis]